MCTKMTNCNLTTCRYNKNGKCTNEEKRKECVDVSRKVLCLYSGINNWCGDCENFDPIGSRPRGGKDA